MAIKKVKTKLLRPGMFVDRFDRNWLETPFFTKSVMIKNDGMITKILEMGIHEVFIDTAKGDDVSDAPTLEEAHAESTKSVQKIAAEPVAPIVGATFVEEIKRAVPIRNEAVKVMTTAMRSIRDGQKVDQNSMAPLVDDLVESIYNNSNAMLCLNRIRDRDSYTFQHSVSVCTLTTAFGKHLNLPKNASKHIAVGALLHDLGKMYIPNEVLNKPDKLTPAEFDIMKSHVLQAKKAFKDYDSITAAAESVIMQHHEKYDGSGYPYRLKGEEISQIGLMGAIVDVYDALTADRVYHAGMSPTEALRKLYDWGKYHFKMELVEQFIKCVGIYPSGTLVALTGGFVGVVLEPSTKGSIRPKIRIVFDSKKTLSVKPFDLDLSDDNNLVYGEITRVEKPGAFGINPMEHLLQGLGVGL
jgi:HD-GYP domain-containing protein (c-di-GMP phosphodiesterase class II)